MTAMALPDPEHQLPAASERQGDPGHDQATDRVVGIRLLTMRAAGMTYQQMADELGYASSSGARQALLRALDRHEVESAKHLRALEHEAYLSDQRVLRAIISDTSAGTSNRIKAIDARTRSSARFARLMGLDAPVQVALSVGLQAELDDALAEVRQVVMGEATDVHDDDPANEV